MGLKYYTFCGLIISCFQLLNAQNQLYIEVSQGDQSDLAVIYLEENATEAYDPEYDAMKFMANSLHISSISTDGYPLSINALPQRAAELNTSLNIETTTSGEFHISFSNINSFSDGSSILLLDQNENKEYRIEEGSSLPFLGAEELIEGRFTIKILNNNASGLITSLASATSIDNTLKVFPNPSYSGKITLEASQHAINQYSIYNTQGKMHLQGERSSHQSPIHEKELQLLPGEYIIISTHDNGKTIRKKVVIKNP